MSPSVKGFGRHRWRVVLILSVLVVVLVSGWLIWRNLTRTVIPFGQVLGEVAFIQRNTNWDIAILSADGFYTVTDGDAWDDYFASFDFRGERINFLSLRAGELGPTQVQPDRSGLRTLGVVDAVTTMVFEGRFDWDASWSPDGTKLLWSSLRDLNLELYVADNQPNAAPLRLTNHPARDWFASWSPDGTRIAFASDRAGNEDIYVMDADGANLRQLTNHPANDIFPVWSLDGETLLFVSERDTPLGNGSLTLYLLDPDADSPTPAALGQTRFEGDPTYSPDGREVVFMSNRDGDWSLYSMDADGGNLRRLTDTTTDELFPVWRPAMNTD